MKSNNQQPTHGGNSQLPGFHSPYRDNRGCLHMFKHKHIFSTVSKGIVACFVSFGFSPSTTLCTVSCVLRFGTFTKGVEVTRQDFVVLRGNILGACRLRCNRGKLVLVCHGVVCDAVEVITSSHKFTAVTRLVKCDVLCLFVRVSIKGHWGNTTLRLALSSSR